LAKVLHSLFEYLVFALTSNPIQTSSILYEHITDDKMGKMYGLNQFKSTRAGLLLAALLEAPALRAITSAAKCQADHSGELADDDGLPQRTGLSIVTPSLFMKHNYACIPIKQGWNIIGLPNAPTPAQLFQKFNQHLPVPPRRLPVNRSKAYLVESELSDEEVSMWFTTKNSRDAGLAVFFTARSPEQLCRLNDPTLTEVQVREHELYGIQPAEIRSCHVKLHEYLHQLAVFSIVNEQTRTICAESKLSVYGPTLKQPVCDALEVCKQLLVNVM
jgi:hypothetical protein